VNGELEKKKISILFTKEIYIHILYFVQKKVSHTKYWRHGPTKRWEDGNCKYLLMQNCTSKLMFHLQII